VRGRAGRWAATAAVVLWLIAWTLYRPSAEPADAARVAIRQAPVASVTLTPSRVAAEPAPDHAQEEAVEAEEVEAVEEAGVEAREPEPSSDPAEPDSGGVARAEDIARGESLLGGGGAFPPLQASYEALGSFAAYARAMHALGARFVVVENQRIVGEVDVAGEVIGAAMPAGRFSPRARDYSDEPALTATRRRVREHFGAGATLMMLVPRELDAALFGSVSRWLASRGESPEDYRELEARYARAADGSLRLHLDTGTRLDGTHRAFDLVFELGTLVGQGA
jgi:hypothetical protein